MATIDDGSPIRVWRLQYGPCLCRGGPDESGGFDFVRMATSRAPLGDLDRNILIVSDRVIDGSQPMILQLASQVPEPRLVVAAATCPAAEEFWEELPVPWSPLDQLLAADVRVEECVTGNPESLLAAVLEHVVSDLEQTDVLAGLSGGSGDLSSPVGRQVSTGGP